MIKNKIIKNLNLKRNLKIEKDLKTLLSKVREIKKRDKLLCSFVFTIINYKYEQDG
jgi:hypothetical protein